MPLAATPHFRNAAPITGMASFANVEFDFDMRVDRVAEHPRITKPFSDESWAALDALGNEVDRVLKDKDVRLTMGGEPTFVSIDDFEADEWNTAAVGPTKREKADALIRRLRERFAPGGFLHYGQGKWYPGESLPRWTFSLYWRADGEPVWSDPALIAGEQQGGKVGPEDARNVLTAIADGLGVSTEMVAEAYEDPAEWLLREGKLPDNVDPSNSKLEDPEERARMAHVFERGLTRPSGYVLPVQRWNAAASDPRWRSEKWKTRRGKLFLVPGDSPVGYRLPLGSLPYVPPAQYPYIVPVDPSVPRGALPARAEILADPAVAAAASQRAQAEASFTAAAARQDRVEQELGEIGGAVRTAITVEPRDGRLCIFMPPVEALEDYLELVAAAEDAARKIGLPVHIEGYGAAARSAPQRHPRRARSRRHRGQHPSGRELGRLRRDHDGDLRGGAAVAARRRQVHDRRPPHRHRRRQPRRGRRRDAQRQPVPAPARPVEEPGAAMAAPPVAVLPVLRPVHRPDQPGAALRRGPPRQPLRAGDRDGAGAAPRQGRRTAAVAGRPAVPQPAGRRHRQHPPLGDLHRQAVLAGRPDRPARPGRVPRLRDAAQCPHEPRPAIAGARPDRPAVEEPARRPLRALGHRRCTTASCCRTTSGRISSTCSTTSASTAFPFRPEWFDAQLEFRFPFCGKVEYAGVRLELRQALEPWHVMGEQGAIGGTVRYVDSSVERLQVKTEGLNPERHAVLCNGRFVPMKATDNREVAVAGVRFKAWQPASGLHPALPVNTPLTFDIYDRWSGRSVGGCVYHVAHPGGRSYDTFPVNANEAEARRLARFEPRGHTPACLHPGERRTL